tara:strand:+ start:10299 stop:10670 length:372 start_codon:yes stop_codon:yes gene_type:complete
MIMESNVVFLNVMAGKIYASNKQRGWWGDGDNVDPHVIGTKMCLIHSEVSEMMEGFRKGLPDDKLPHRPMAEVEAADVIIRLLDLAGSQGWDLDGAVREKLEFNSVRPDHKAEARAAFGGKSF